MPDNVIALWPHKLKKEPVRYTIEFVHDSDGFHFIVHDVQDSKHDRLSVMADLQAAANSLQDSTD